MIESYQIARMRKGGEKQTLRGFEMIHLSVTNLTWRDIQVELLGNGRSKLKSDEVSVHNYTPFYDDDDNNLTLLKNYINSVGYIEVVKFRLQSNNSNQVSQILNIYDDFGSDKKQVKTIIPEQFRSPYQFQQDIVDVRSSAKFKSETTLSFNLIAGVTFNIVMFCGRNKGDIEVKVKSFYDEIQDTITDCQHFVPSMNSGKKRILMLKI